MELNRRQVLLGLLASLAAPKAVVAATTQGVPRTLTATWETAAKWDTAFNLIMISAVREMSEVEDRRFLKMLDEVTGCVGT